MMVARLSSDVRKAVLTSAAEEARRRGDRRIGTDHMLLGLLHDPHSLAPRVLGVELESARAASDDLDRAALAAVGVDVGPLSPRSRPPQGRAHPPLTSGARAVLMRSVLEARTAKVRRIEARFLLLALLTRERPDPAAELLAALGIDPAEPRERLTHSAD
jgi:ATP-dependent Clp protease ATP-binding subunit ClpA